MASRGINKVILIGNLGQDPEVRYMPNGGAVTNITIATSESWKDKQSGEQKERTEWHRIVFMGKLAEFAGEYAQKGTQIYVEGKLQTRKWTDQGGQERYTTEVLVDSFNGEFRVLSNGRDNRGNQGQRPAQNQQPQNNQRPAQNQQPQNGNQGGQNNRPAQQPQQSAAPAQQPQSAPPVYNEPPMDFDDDIPF